MGAFPRLPDGREYYLERPDDTGETYLKIRGKDLKAGDDLIFLSAVHRITDLVPYKHPKSEEYGWGPGWQTAYARTTEIKVTDRTWGITIEPDGWYEVSKSLLQRPGFWTWLSPNGVVHLVPDTGPCATCGQHHEREDR